MITKIQGFIEDNTNIDVTRNQVMMAVAVFASLILLVVVFLFVSSTGPQKDDVKTTVAPPNPNAPAHTGK